MLRNYDLKDVSSIIEFIDECIVVRTTSTTLDEYTCGDVYNVYKIWCIKNNKGNYETRTKFKEYLRQFGIGDIIKTNGGSKYYRNINLNESTIKKYNISLVNDTTNENNVEPDSVAIYIQLDEDECNDGMSLEEQISKIYKYCLDKKYNVLGTYCDIGDYENYYQYRELIDHLWEQKVVKIIALNPDRIYNSFYNEVSDLIEALKCNDAELEFVDNYIEIPDRNYQLLSNYINNVKR